MTISEYLYNERKSIFSKRLAKLTELGAPEYIINYEKARAENPLKGIGGLRQFGSVTFVTVTEHVGLRGKSHLRFACNNGGGDILCVLSTKGWGRYLYQQKGKANL